MKLQNFKEKNLNIIRQFIELRKKSGMSTAPRLNFSWSNWCFGMEDLAVSAKRLRDNNVKFVELHGNKYGNDLGYRAEETNKILGENGIRVSGICGMVYPESEFASNNHFVRQQCIDYFRRHIEFCSEVGGTYILFSPGAVGRSRKYDDYEFYRAAETIRILGDDFLKAGVRCAIEPVRRDEVSICHTLEDARALIEEIGHPGVGYIAGDAFHMLLEEKHIGESIVKYGHMMTNLHLADTNRKALGNGMMDLDIIIMALYVAGYNNEKCFCSPEPLGTGSNPYEVMYGRHDPKALDELVRQTASCFYEREDEILKASDSELLACY